MLKLVAKISSFEGVILCDYGEQAHMTNTLCVLIMFNGHCPEGTRGIL